METVDSMDTIVDGQEIEHVEVITILAFLVTILFFLHLFLTWNDTYWLKLDVPFLEPSKLFGNIKDVIFMRKTMGEAYKDIYNKLEGKPLGGFFKLRTPILMVRDPELVGRVLNDDFVTFQNNDFQIIRGVDPILKNNPFLAQGAAWNTTRAVLTPSQSPEKLRHMVPLLVPICQDMVDYINKQPELMIEVKDLCGKFTTDVMASFSFGKEVYSFKYPDAQFREMTAKLFNGGIRSNIALLCAFYAPSLGNLLKFRIVPNSISEFFIGLVTEMCKLRIREGIQREDFIQELIDINKESEANGEGTAYNYKQMAGHCMAFLLDGYCSSCTALCFCLHDLAMNPECQKKAREEVQANIDKVGDFHYHKLQKLPYLDKFISESLRMHPAIQTITRKCLTNTVLSKGGHDYTVEAGTPVTIPVYALHMDPKYFPEPEKFIPERFDSDKVKSRPRYVYLPFGEGPRICLGMNFAQLQLKAALASILMNFEVKPKNSSEVMTLDPSQSFFTTPKGNLWLEFKKL